VASVERSPLDVKTFISAQSPGAAVHRGFYLEVGHERLLRWRTMFPFKGPSYKCRQQAPTAPQT
jgi:hypothetical protein